ncbi:MAG: DUF3298 and DUF4163 domain-containing protein [Cyclobacteriaceae bacterium]|nr:DUF3298 and DUF4163 domain-containing protein [Cyclobacteriaceae bacterium SS2]
MSLRLAITTIVLCYCLYGCDTPAKKGENIHDQGIYNENIHQKYEQEVSPKLVFETKVLSRKEGQCENNCAKVTIHYPLFNESDHKIFNQFIENQIKSVLEDFTMSNKPLDNYEAQVEEFIQSYKSFKNEFPDVQTPWTIEIEIAVTYQHASFLTFSTTTSAYTGGAHPLSNKEYQNLSMDGYKIEDLDYFISDQEKLKELAEKQFRSAKNLTVNQPFSDAGFTFDNDEFYLTENFGFNEAGIVFYYNSYEIGPYALGPTEVVISYAALQGVYKYQAQL